MGCIGRLEPEKGTEYVLKAFEQSIERAQSIDCGSHTAISLGDGARSL